MSYPHRIRLRGPWQAEPLNRLEPGDPLPAPLTIRMPGRLLDSSLHGFRGRVRFRRAFGYPGRIDDNERVWLTFAGVAGGALVELNGQPLGDLPGTGEFDVTSLLRQRNIVTVDVECTAPTDGLWDEVALEVRATAFLRQVHFRLTGNQLEANGVVVGSAERPLELYLLADNRCQAYQPVEAAVTGQPFTLTAQLPGPFEDTVVPVRVELVHGATVWYVVQETIQAQSAGGADSSYS
jgi:hypothetical protein